MRQVFFRHFAPMFMAVSCLALAASLTAGQTHAQASLSVAGVVVDQNDAPVADAEVTVANEPLLNSRTDTSGRFQIYLIESKTITLVINASSFAPLERKLTVTRPITLRLVLSPAPVSQQVTVTATRAATRIDEVAASIVVLGPEDLNSTAAITLDDTLRAVTGFSLFRRSGSRTANPTAQGVSLRGLGASGASRALVLADGIPINDPFGGWVYWDRVPRDSVSQVEVLKGGASHLYGGPALGGVVSISTKQTPTNAFGLNASFGNEMTANGSFYLSGKRDSWTASLAGEVFHTDGYVLVPENQRGLVDTAADSRHAVIDLKLGKLFGEGRRVFAGASFFGESRKNGTPLQINRTHIRSFATGGDWQFPKAGSFTVRAYGGTQVYDQTFSAISADRNSESLTRLQRVPAQVIGGSIQWTRAAGQRHTFVAGLEAHQVRGASDEIVFVNNQPSSLVDVSGREFTAGFYVADLIRLGSRLFLNVGGRSDHWRNYHAFSRTRALTGTPARLTLFPDRTENAFSPQLSALYKLSSRLSLLASANRAFRAPTLNEFYRSFRVGNVLTLANENLRAEHLTGVETGARLTALREQLILKGVFFWSEIKQPVANVTLTATPALITRQRQNLGRTRSRGLELESDVRINQQWSVSASYLFDDARVVEFPANTALEGLMIPQVPRHQFTFQLRYANPAVLTAGVQTRAASAQFDDDQNLFRLNPYLNVDLFVSRRVARGLELFVAIENVFGQRYESGKTPLITLGPPILARAGFRFSRSPNH